MGEIAIVPAAQDVAGFPAEATELDHLAQITDEAARHALAHYTDEQWQDPAFAAILLNAARSLRSAGRQPSEAIIEAMERSTAAGCPKRGVQQGLLS